MADGTSKPADCGERGMFEAALRLAEPDRDRSRKDEQIGRWMDIFLSRAPHVAARPHLWRDVGAAVPLARALREAWVAAPNSDRTRRLARQVLDTAAVPYPTSSLKELDGSAPLEVVERWRCRADGAALTVSIGWTPPYLPTARISGAANLPEGLSSRRLFRWREGDARRDLLKSAAGLQRYACATDLQVDVLRPWPDVPVYSEEIVRWREGTTVPWSARIGPPEPIDGVWLVRADLDGTPCLGQGRSPVFAVLSVLRSLSRADAMLRGVHDHTALFDPRAPGEVTSVDALPEADVAERWTTRDGRVWEVAATWPEDHPGPVWPEQREGRVRAVCGRVREVGGADTGQAWGMASAYMFAELRDQLGVVSTEVLRWPSADRPWASLVMESLPECRVEVGAPRPVRGGASVDVSISDGASAERLVVHDAGPLLALVAAGEGLHAKLEEWLTFGSR